MAQLLERRLMSILDKAKEIIYGDREKTYGHPSKNLSLIAEYWSGHLSNAKKRKSISLTVDDVCVMMVLLKLARLANDPTHIDSKVDTAGYIALMDRCQNSEDSKNSNLLENTTKAEQLASTSGISSVSCDRVIKIFNVAFVVTHAEYEDWEFRQKVPTRLLHIKLHSESE